MIMPTPTNRIVVTLDQRERAGHDDEQQRGAR
jgi:hypothetical protein